jgi:hypothetical protein
LLFATWVPAWGFSHYLSPMAFALSFAACGHRPSAMGVLLVSGGFRLGVPRF